VIVLVMIPEYTFELNVETYISGVGVLASRVLFGEEKYKIPNKQEVIINIIQINGSVFRILSPRK
jgi:hypothetical protein